MANALDAQKGRPAIAYGAIDLHSTQSQVRIVTDAGEIVDRRIPTTRDQFARLFPPDPPMRVLLEASTESVEAEVGVLWEVLTEQAVAVLVGATLPGAVGVG